MRKSNLTSILTILSFVTGIFAQQYAQPESFVGVMSGTLKNANVVYKNGIYSSINSLWGLMAGKSNLKLRFRWI